ncbi:MAG: LysR family transcriptional regulator [Woeseiaceae bacterium]
MDKFEDMQAFTAVVETGSFTAAADRLKANKSAVSRRVSALEERLGAQLLKRTTRTLNLTETGRSFYERSARLLADLDEAESAVAQEQGELRGRLKIALPLSFGLMHMTAPINEFACLHPRVEFNLDLSDRYVDLIQEDIDVAVRIGRLTDSSLIARRLFKSRIVAAASPDYLEANGIPETPADLAEHRCLNYSNLVDSNHWSWIDEDGQQQLVEIHATLAANNGDMLSKFAANGLGIVMQPTFIAHKLLRDGTLTQILPDVSWPETTAYAVYPPTRHLSYRVRAFIDFLADYFQGTTYWDRDCESC